MSTPIENNTEELRNILQQVNELPESGGSGTDGFSPIATVTQTEDGAIISITDKVGTTTATITNGKDGKDGVDGAPGVWTGTEPPPDDSYTVWLDPSEEPSASEEWIFILGDGSTVTKKVVVQ